MAQDSIILPEISADNFEHAWKRFRLAAVAKQWQAEKQLLILPTLLRGNLVDYYMDLGDDEKRSLEDVKQLFMSVFPIQHIHLRSTEATPMAARSCDDLREHSILNLEGLDQRREIGRGAYGAVYEVKMNGLPCIAKGLHQILLGMGGYERVGEKEVEAIRRKILQECSLLSKLKHPNIVQFLGIHHTKENDVLLVMECMHMDLAKYLGTHPDIPLQLKLAILLDVSYGLLHMHSQTPPIIHRDLTAANVLLTEGLRAKIADLGVSKVFNLQQIQRAAHTAAPGTQAYMPPEALSPTPHYDTKLDVFSFGVLSLYTANQEFPSVHEPPMNTTIVRSKEVQIFKRKHWIDQMGEDHTLHPLVIQCLQDHPDQRSSTKELSDKLSDLCTQHSSKWETFFEEDSVKLKLSGGKLEDINKKQSMELAREHKRNEELTKQLEEAKYARMSSEFTALQEENKVLFKEAEYLRKEVTTLRNQSVASSQSSSEATIECKKLNTEVQFLQNELKKQRARCTELEVNLRSMASSSSSSGQACKFCEVLRAQLAEKEGAITAAQHAKESAIAERDGRLSLMMTKVQKFEQVAKNTAAVVSASQMLKADLESQILKLQMENRGLEEKYSGLAMQLETARKKILQLDEATRRQAAAGSETEELRRSVVELKGRNGDLMTTIKDLNRKYADLMNMNGDLERQLEQKRDDRSKQELQDKLDLYDHENQSQLDEAARRQAAAGSELEELRGEVAELKGRNGDLMSTINDLNRTNAELRKWNGDLERQLEQMRDVRSKQELQDRLALYENLLQVYENDFKQERRDRENIHTKLSDLEEKYKKREECINTKEEEYADLKWRYNDMERRYAELEQRHIETEQQFGGFQHSYADLQRQVVALQDEVQAKNQLVKQYMTQVANYMEQLAKYEVKLREHGFRV